LYNIAQQGWYSFPLISAKIRLREVKMHIIKQFSIFMSQLMNQLEMPYVFMFHLKELGVGVGQW
jgi:hypothetical protein